MWQASLFISGAESELLYVTWLSGAIFNVPQPAAFIATVQHNMLVEMDEVKELLGSEGTTLIDSREAPRYRGEIEPIDIVAGFIPATPNVIALEEAGFTKVRLNAGNWSDWISYGGNAVATGGEEKA